MEAIVEPTIERWFTEPFRRQDLPILDKVRAMIRATPVAGFIGCAKALQGLDLMPRLGRVAAPTLFLVGAQDIGTPPAAMKAMHRARRRMMSIRHPRRSIHIGAGVVRARGDSELD